MSETITLASKLEAWAYLRKEANALEAEIKVEVLELKQTLTVDSARATYGSGRKTYDYETIAGKLGAIPEEIDVHSRIVTNWKKVCDDVGWPAAGEFNGDVRERYHKQARPYASLKLL